MFIYFLEKYFVHLVDNHRMFILKNLFSTLVDNYRIIAHLTFYLT